MFNKEILLKYVKEDEVRIITLTTDYLRSDFALRKEGFDFDCIIRCGEELVISQRPELVEIAEQVEEKEDPIPDIHNMKKDELVELCGSLGLDDSGYKKELIERLEWHYLTNQ